MPRALLALSLLVALCALSVPIAEAGRAGRSRPQGAGSGSRPTQTAQGTASYGYGSHRGHHPYYGHRGYPYGPSYYWGWGWPYYRGVWWYPPTPAGWTAGVPQTLPGTVETDVTPGRAELWLDGEKIGRARDFNGRWDGLDLAPGDHVLEFRRDGYRTLTRHVRMHPGGFDRIEARLEKGTGPDPRSTEAPPPEPAQPERVADSPTAAGFTGTLVTGLLRLAVEPEDAAVYLDGEFLARADELARLHGALSVAAGHHVVEVARPGYASSRIGIDVTEGEPARVDVVLERLR